MSYNFQDQPSESQSEWLGREGNMNNDKWWHKYKSDVPVQLEGNWRIYKGTNEEVVTRKFPPGTAPSEPHTALMKDNGEEWQTVMSDSRIEIADNLPFVANAYGKVLITGLGLGIVTHMLMEKPNIDRILIVEKSPIVVDMVAEYLPQGDITVVISDAFTYTPNEQFDCAWHDIWTSHNSDMASEIERLMDRYRKYVDGFQMGWLYEAAKVLRSYSSKKENEEYQPDKEMLSGIKEMVSFEKDRDKYIDKSTWDTTTESKIRS